MTKSKKGQKLENETDSKQVNATRFNAYIADKDALIQEVMENYGERLIRLAYTYVKNWNDAEDIVQEVFTTCYTKIDTFRGEGSLKSWLYTITVNRCKDHLKSWFHRNIWTDLFFEKVIPSQEKSPEILLIVEDEYRELADQLLSLPLKYRELIILHYQEGMGIQEIADLLEMNPSTVKSRLYRGRQQLKKKLTDFEKGRSSRGGE